MDSDKQSAYATLREVIGLYCQIAAPFAPFVTEWVWQQMQQFVKTDSVVQNSVHLGYWPLPGKQYINTDLIEEIGTVRKIIK